jgi:peptide/nickel transport system substrate-binding protein
MIVVALAACAPAPTSRQSGQPTGGSGPSSAAQPNTGQSTRALRMVMRSEPGSVAGTILIPTGITTSTQRRLFNAGLVLEDGDGKYRPYLAESAPTLNTDSWRVFPDGRMETIYRLKPNLTWHNGDPLTAEDFVFARTVYSSPDYGISRSVPHVLMEAVEAPDPQTVLIRWKELYPDAAELDEQAFAPLPRGVLTSVHEREREALPNHAFWTTEYVGAGPYRIDRWEPGAFIEAAAFTGHVLGKPKIERLRLTWNSDFNSTLAMLLAGEADMPIDDSIRVEQGLVLERDWAPRKAGTVTYRPHLPRFIQVQHREQYANPQGVRDVRVRRALAHAIDRPVINESLFEGKGLTTDTLIYPTLDYYAQVDRAAAKYSFDIRQSEALMNEAGFRKGSDGIYLQPNGSRMNLEIRNIQSAQNDAERSIISDGWRRAGWDVEEDVFTPTQTRDGQTLGTFRALSVTSAAAQPEGLNLPDYKTESVSRPETRWTGQNRGGWTNAEYDRVVQTYLTTLEPRDRHAAVAEAVKILTTDLGIIPLHFNPGAIAYASGLHGIALKAPASDISWNIHEWELR